MGFCMLRLVNTFTIDTDEYYLMCYKVNDTKTLQAYIILGFVRAHKSSHNTCIADWLIELSGAFKIILL